MEQRDTPIIFLAMFWGGGGPYTIPEIIHAYDWINRDVPDREQMESALNTLLAMGLIEKQDDRFRVNRSRGQEFDVFWRFLQEAHACFTLLSERKNVRVNSRWSGCISGSCRLLRIYHG